MKKSIFILLFLSVLAFTISGCYAPHHAYRGGYGHGNAHGNSHGSHYSFH